MGFGFWGLRVLGFEVLGFGLKGFGVEGCLGGLWAWGFIVFWGLGVRGLSLRILGFRVEV